MNLKRMLIVTAFLAAGGLSQVGCQNNVAATPRDSDEGLYVDRPGDIYAEAAEQNSDKASAYESRGLEEYRRGLFQEAVDDFSKAIDLRPGYALNYERRAWAYYALKDYESAWTDVKICKQRGGKPDPTLIDNLTKIDSHSGQAE